MITHQEARKELKQILLSKIDVLYDYITQQEKQEKLLKLYQKLNKDFDDLTLHEQKEIEKRIKELENDK